jgi:hypothetical protein
MSEGEDVAARMLPEKEQKIEVKSDGAGPFTAGPDGGRLACLCLSTGSLCLFTFCCLLPILVLVLNIVLALMVSRDARSRNESGLFWGMLTLILGPIGVVLYIIFR